MSCPLQNPEKVDRLLDDVSAIRRAVLGDPQTKSPGLIDRVQKLENWRTGLDLRAATVAGAVTGAAFLAKHLLKL